MTDKKIFHYSFPVNLNNIYSILNEYKNVPRVFWKQNQNDLTFIGFGEVENLVSKGSDRFIKIDDQLKNIFGYFENRSSEVPELVRPRFFGGFSFQINEKIDNLWDSFPEAKLILPKILFTNDGLQTWATICLKVKISNSVEDVKALIDHEKQKILETVESSNNFEKKEVIKKPSKLSLVENKSDWKKIVNSALKKIDERELEKVVLARTCKIDFSEFVDLAPILERLSQDYPNCSIFMFEFKKGDVFFGASPETIISVEKSGFQTIALAGSIERGKKTIEDQQLGLKLLNSEKDLHEHDLVVKNLVKKLKAFTKNLNVSSNPGLRKLKNIQHLETRIFGKLKKNSTALTLLSSLHPTPALGGTPKESALNFIRESEKFTRGWYAGPVGWVDSEGDGKFAVAIRSGLLNKKSIRLFAGAGIVKGSDPAKEWEETKIKFEALKNVLIDTGIQNEIY